MRHEIHRDLSLRRLAVIGGAYGNVPALEASLRHARARGCNGLAFIGDATGCCGHSDEIVELVTGHFDLLLAGNLEQQAFADSADCGCNYAAAEDERYGCLAHQIAMASLSPNYRARLGGWPELLTVEMAGGRLLLCHGSPDATNEFLHESQLDDSRLDGWLDRFRVNGFVCTHSGLPWIRQLSNGRFAANCGAVGKPDHDGDTAVHYAIVEWSLEAGFSVSIERVEYDWAAWVDQLAREAVDEVFLAPLRTGVWTFGVASLPACERPSRRRFAASNGAPL